MAILATAQWWIRTDGSNTNGGGYDGQISGAGTNYCDQAASQLSVTDAACNNNTTLTSATGGFTAAMIGNAVRISGGTNFTAGYYFITAHTDTNTVTIDRNPTTGSNASGGTATVGGAFATVGVVASGGTATQPAITNFIVPGNIINLRGTGGDSPTADDYTISAGYYTYPDGTHDDPITWIGYNGRPRIGAPGLWHYQSDYHTFDTGFWFANGTENPTFGFSSSEGTVLRNMKIDQNGKSIIIGRYVAVISSDVYNSGVTTAYAQRAFDVANYHMIVYGSSVRNLRNTTIFDTNRIASIVNSIFYGNNADVIICSSQANTYRHVIVNNVFHDNGGDAITVTPSGNQDNSQLFIMNNIFTNNGAYAIDITSGTSVANTRSARGRIYNNAYRSNTSGDYNNLSAEPGKVTLTADPYTDAASDDFSLNDTAGGGAACKAAGIPGAFLGISTTSYVDLGAAQREEPAGGGGVGPRVQQVNSGVILVY